MSPTPAFFLLPGEVLGPIVPERIGAGGLAQPGRPIERLLVFLPRADEVERRGGGVGRHDETPQLDVVARPLPLDGWRIGPGGLGDELGHRCGCQLEKRMLWFELGKINSWVSAVAPRLSSHRSRGGRRNLPDRTAAPRRQPFLAFEEERPGAFGGEDSTTRSPATPARDRA